MIMTDDLAMARSQELTGAYNEPHDHIDACRCSHPRLHYERHERHSTPAARLSRAFTAHIHHDASDCLHQGTLQSRGGLSPPPCAECLALSPPLLACGMPRMLNPNHCNLSPGALIPRTKRSCNDPLGEGGVESEFAELSGEASGMTDLRPKMPQSALRQR